MYIMVIYKQEGRVERLSRATGFEWDEWNGPKIWKQHSVSQAECEQVFFNEPLVVAEEVEHSEEEQRYYVLGRTDQARELSIVFTMRQDRIRVITARDMSRKERRIYRNVDEEASS
jgi:hypothetical protein